MYIRSAEAQRTLDYRMLRPSEALKPLNLGVLLAALAASKNPNSFETDKPRQRIAKKYIQKHLEDQD